MPGTPQQRTSSPASSRACAAQRWRSSPPSRKQVLDMTAPPTLILCNFCGFGEKKLSIAVGLAIIIQYVGKSPFGIFPPDCIQNCKIELCKIILQFFRCGGGSNAKGYPDGFLSHVSSLRNFWLDRVSESLYNNILLSRDERERSGRAWSGMALFMICWTLRS